MRKTLAANPAAAATGFFVPRQVTLLKRPPAAMAGDSKSSKSKKEKGFAQEPAGGEAAANETAREVVLRSIATFLRTNGFRRTLSAFESEAGVELNVLKTSPFNLEDLVIRFLDTSSLNFIDSAGKEKEPVEEVPGIAGKDKKKKKKSVSSEGVANQPDVGTAKAENPQAVEAPDSIKSGKSKDRRDDSVVGKPEEEGKFEGIVKAKVEELKSLVEESSEQNLRPDQETSTINGKDDSIAKSEDKIHKKKTKKKAVSVENLESNQQVVPSKVTDNVLESSKSKKRKAADTEFPGQEDRENSGGVVEDKGEGLQCPVNGSLKSHHKKKKLKGDDSSGANDTPVDVVEMNSTGGGVSEIKEKKKEKGKKKEKMNLENPSAPTSGNAHLAGTLEEAKTSNDGTNSPDVKSSSEGKPASNGLVDNSAEKGSNKSKSDKKKEPTSAVAFRRVKADNVQFADQRLQDNSYWAKSGAETGYGAKAQMVLGQVRGRDFRSEKTKKKRGTYFGGQVDLQSHSVKFNYSDDE